jgi:hypothetical protein
LYRANVVPALFETSCLDSRRPHPRYHAEFCRTVEAIPPELRGAVQPQVAVAPSGRIHVVFGKDTAIYHTASANGRSFSAPVKIGELEKLALRMRRGPRIHGRVTRNRIMRLGASWMAVRSR